MTGFVRSSELLRFATWPSGVLSFCLLGAGEEEEVRLEALGDRLLPFVIGGFGELLRGEYDRGLGSTLEWTGNAGLSDELFAFPLSPAGERVMIGSSATNRNTVVTNPHKE